MNKETEKQLPFQNMRANLMLDGKIQEEDIAIKNVWHKGVNVFLDVYLYNQDKSIIIDSLYVKEMHNLESGETYRSVKEFIDDFLNFKYDKKSGFQGSRNDEHLQQLQRIRNDLIILSYVAGYDNSLSDIKIKSIEEYIYSICPETKILSESYLRGHIMEINATEEDFYNALDEIKNKNSKEATKLFMEAAKIAASDGYINYDERVWLAEIMQTLREYDISPKDCII